MILHFGAAERRARPIDPPSRPTPRIVSWRGNMGVSGFAGSVHFDNAERIEIQGGDFAIGLFQREPVEPELVVLAVRVPASCLLLHEFDDGAGRFDTPGVI